MSTPECWGLPDGSVGHFDEEMPRLLKVAVGLPPGERLDAVVVDEAQDFARCGGNPSVGVHWTALTTGRCMPPWMTIRTCIAGGGADRHRRAPAVWLTWCGSTSTRTSQAPARSRRRSSVSPGNTPHAEGGARACPCEGWSVPTDDALGVAGDCVDALIGEGWPPIRSALLHQEPPHPIHQDYFERNDTAGYWREFHANDAESTATCSASRVWNAPWCDPVHQRVQGNGPGGGTAATCDCPARSLLVVVGDSGTLLAEAGGESARFGAVPAQAWDPASVG